MGVIDAALDLREFLDRLKGTDELLNGEIFYTLKEAKIVIEGWRRHYNTIRPHSSLRYQPPAPEVLQWPAAQPQPASPATPALASNQTVN